MNATRSEHFTLDRVSKVYSAGQPPQFDYFINSNEIKQSGQFATYRYFGSCFLKFSEGSDNGNLTTLLSHLRSRASAVRPAMDTAT